MNIQTTLLPEFRITLLWALKPKHLFYSLEFDLLVNQYYYIHDILVCYFEKYVSRKGSAVHREELWFWFVTAVTAHPLSEGKMRPVCVLLESLLRYPGMLGLSRMGRYRM